VDELNKCLCESLWNGLEQLKIFIDHGANPRINNDILLSVVFDQPAIEHYEIISYLLDLGLDPNSNEALLSACEYSNTNVIKLLLDAGAVIDNKVVNLVSVEKNGLFAKLLIEYGAKPRDFFRELILSSDCDIRTNTVLFLLLMSSDEIDYTEVLKECAMVVSDKIAINQRRKKEKKVEKIV